MKIDTWHIDIDQLEYELNLHRPTASTNPYPESVVSSFQIGGKLHLLTIADNHCGQPPPISGQCLVSPRANGCDFPKMFDYLLRWHDRESSAELLHENQGFAKACCWGVILLLGFQVASSSCDYEPEKPTTSDKGMQLLLNCTGYHQDTQKVYRFSMLGHTTSIDWSFWS